MYGHNCNTMFFIFFIFSFLNDFSFFFFTFTFRYLTVTVKRADFIFNRWFLIYALKPTNIAS